MVRLAFVAERARCPGEALDLAGACCQWQMAHGKWQDGGRGRGDGWRGSGAGEDKPARVSHAGKLRVEGSKATPGR